MTDAALDDESSITIEDENLSVEQETSAESAPAEQVETPAEPEVDLSDRAQKRFNQITARVFAATRRADDLQRQLDERPVAQQVQAPQSAPTAPKLEDFDYDDGKFSAAQAAHQEKLIHFAVNEKAQEIANQQQQAQQAQSLERVEQAFNARAVTFSESAADYSEVVGNLPRFPDDIANAVKSAQDGPQLAYYLGQHLDVADEIASASPMVAAMRLGEIAANLKPTKPTVKTSAAPDPIKPISGGGAISKSVDDMTMEEIYNS